MPTIEQMEWFFKTGANYGIGFVLLSSLVGILIYATWRISRAVIKIIEDGSEWLPKLVKSHIGFLQTTEQTSVRVAKATEAMTDSHMQSQGNHGKTHRALHSIAKAQQMGDVCDEARRYLDDAIRELK